MSLPSSQRKEYMRRYYRQRKASAKPAQLAEARRIARFKRRVTKLGWSIEAAAEPCRMGSPAAAGYLLTREVAERAGVTDSAVTYAIRRGELRAARIKIGAKRHRLEVAEMDAAYWAEIVALRGRSWPRAQEVGRD